MGKFAGEGWCRGGAWKRDARDAARPVTRFLLHVARRAFAEMGGRDSFAIQDAVDLVDCSGHLRGGLRFVHSDRRPRRTCEYWDAARVRDRMRGRLDPAQETPKSSAALQDAAGSPGTDSRYSLLRGRHVEPAGEDLVALAHLAGNRTLDLCVLWPNPQQSPPSISE